jgi:hypothetical protein
MEIFFFDPNPSSRPKRLERSSWSVDPVKPTGSIHSRCSDDPMQHREHVPGSMCQGACAREHVPGSMCQGAWA